MLASMQKPAPSTQSAGPTSAGNDSGAQGGSFQIAKGGGGSFIPIPDVTAGVTLDWNQFSAGGQVDIFPENTPWPSFPIPGVPFGFITFKLSVVVTYQGSGDFTNNQDPNASVRLGIGGYVMATGSIKVPGAEAGLEGRLGVTGGLTLRGTRKNWSIEGDMGYDGGLNLVGRLGWATASMPICQGQIAEMEGISFSGQGARVIKSRPPLFKWGNAIQNVINWVHGKQANGSGQGGSGGTAVASAAGADENKPDDLPLAA